MKESIRVFAPATIANVVCGYDVLGLAVDAPGDEVIMRKKDEPGVIITKLPVTKAVFRWMLPEIQLAPVFSII